MAHFNRRLTAGVVGLGLAATVAGAAADGVTLVERELKWTRLNELAVWNLGADKVYEIFATDFSGNAMAFAADSLEPLWSVTLESGALTAPVIGDFMGTGAPILACGSASGVVYFVWPGTGEVISTVGTDLGFVLAPSVAARASGDELILADEKGFVAGFGLDKSTGLGLELFRVANAAQDDTAFSVIGSMSVPPSCADLDLDGGPEIILASETGFLQVISLSADGLGEPRRFHTRLTQNTRATTLAGIGGIAGQPALFGYGIGTSLQFFRWDPAGEPRKAISAGLSAPGYGNTLGHLLIGEINAHMPPDLVSTADSTVAARYVGNDFSGGQTLLDIAPQHLVTQAGPFSAAVPVTLSGAKAVVAVDAGGVAYVWEPASAENRSRRFSDVPVPTGFSPAGDLTGSGKLALAIWNEGSFTLSVATLPVDVASSAEAPPALTLGVNFSRNGQWGEEWGGDYQKRVAGAAEALAAARAMPGGDRDDPALTTDSVSQVAGMDPLDPAVELLAIERGGKGLGMGLLGGVAAAVLVLAGVGVWFFRRR